MKTRILKRKFVIPLFILSFSISYFLVPIYPNQVIIARGAYDSWRRVAEMPTWRIFPACAVVDGKMYVIGGWDLVLNLNEILPTVEEYNPATNTWQSRAAMPTPRYSLAAAVVNGKIYAIGGTGGGTKVEEYDPTTNTWRSRASMPTSRSGLVAAAVNGKIYAIGGSGGIVEEYDPATDTWQSRTPMPTPRKDLAVAVVNGRIYAIGGLDVGPWEVVAAVEEYDPTTDTWTSKQHLPTPRSRLAAATLGGRIYAIDGSYYGVRKVVEEYNPITDTWTRRADSLEGRYGIVAAAVGGRIYITGGNSNYTPDPTPGSYTEKYTPPFFVPISSPQNTTYLSGTIPIYAKNLTNVEIAWWRNWTGSWTDNMTLSWNGIDRRWEEEDLIWGEGRYHVQVFFNDSAGNEVFESRYFTTDATPPPVTIESPQNITYSIRTIPICARNNTEPIHTAWWRYWDDSWSMNQTLTWNGTEAWWEEKNLIWLDGSYQVQVFFNDSVGNEAYATQGFTVEAPPDVTIISPQNATYPWTLPVYATNTTDQVHTAWWRYWNGSWSGNQTMTWDGGDGRWEMEGLAWLEGSYQIQVFFNDSSGQEAFASQWFTVDTTPPAKITDLTIIAPTHSSLNLTWTAPGDDGITGTAMGYDVRYSTSSPVTEVNWNASTSYTQFWTPKSGGILEIHVITGLSSDTQYWFAIKAYDDASNVGEVSNSPSGTTLLAPSSLIISNINVSMFKATSATIEWTTNDTTTVDWIEYGPTRAYGHEMNATHGTSHTATFSGLTPETMYHYRLCSRKPGEEVCVSSDHTFAATNHGIMLWNLTYSWQGLSQANSVIQTADNGYALVGIGGIGQADFGLTKLDANGAVQWHRDIGNSSSSEYAYSGIQLADGGYVLAGYTKPFGSSNADFWLVRTDANGNLLWNQTYGGSDWEEARVVIQTFDSGFALVGWTESYGAGGEDFWLVKTDAEGNLQWNKTYGDWSNDRAYGLVQTTDNGYALGGYNQYLGTDYDFWLVKTDSSGNHEWDWLYTYSSDDKAFSLIQTADDGFALAGTTFESITGDYDAWWVKTDDTGSPQWGGNYAGVGAGDDLVKTVIQLTDGGYVLVGEAVDRPKAADTDYWLVKINSTGGKEWARTYGYSWDDFATSGIVTTDGGFALVGWSFPGGGLMVKTVPTPDADSDGLTDVEEAITYLTNTLDPDTDNDGLNDGDEVITYGTDPLDADTDNDGLSDGTEVNIYGTDPLDPNSPPPPPPPPPPDGGGDGGGEPSPLPVDTDGDGLNDSEEVDIYGTDPQIADTDGDGLSDGDEVTTYGTDPLNADTDGDGLTDYEEVVTYGTNSTAADTDGDGLIDGAEVSTYYTDPTVADADADTDGDGFSNVAEVDAYRTDPTVMDTDGDGLTDGEEVITYGTNPTLGDTDGDGFSDAAEVEASTDPLDPLDPPEEIPSVPEFPLILGLVTVLILIKVRKRRRF